LKDLRAEARAAQRPARFPLFGLDKDEEALEAARRNVNAARLSDEIRLQPGDATQPIEVPLDRPGLIVTNPPYGDRLKAGGQKGMKSFYFKLGENLRRLAGWRTVVLSGNPAFESAFHARPRSRRPLWNGPIECELLSYGSAEALPAPASE
jgi:putative N6-adenine-specific DNA methylase